MGFADPQRIRALAGRIGEGAQLTLVEAAHGGGATNVQWQSLSANRYRARVTEATGRTRAAADQLDELQAALLAHAGAVEHRLAQIQAARSWLLSHVDKAWTEAREAVGDGASEIADTARKLEQSVAGLAHADSRWLDVAHGLGWSL